MLHAAKRADQPLTSHFCVKSWKICSCERAISGVQVASPVALAVTSLIEGPWAKGIWFAKQINTKMLCKPGQFI